LCGIVASIADDWHPLGAIVPKSRAFLGVCCDHEVIIDGMEHDGMKGSAVLDHDCWFIVGSSQVEEEDATVFTGRCEDIVVAWVHAETVDGFCVVEDVDAIAAVYGKGN
jgi:hypothetical protein